MKLKKQIIPTLNLSTNLQKFVVYEMTVKPPKKQRVPYFYRGKLVGFTDSAVNETLQEEAFTDYVWKSRAINLAIAWGIMTLAFVILILGRVL